MISPGAVFVVERDGASWSVYRRRGEHRDREPIETFAAFTMALGYAATEIQKAATDLPESEKP